MAFDFEAARALVEAAKKRGLIRGEGEEAFPEPAPKKAIPGDSVLPDWLQEGMLAKPTPRESGEAG